MPKLFLGSFLLASSVLFSFVLPSSAQSPSADCNTVIRQGSTVNWMTIINGLPFNRGIFRIDAVRSDGGWSATSTNQTGGTRPIGVNGRLNSSSFTLLNAASSETWTGSCNQRGIGGQINGGSGIRFVIW